MPTVGEMADVFEGLCSCTSGAGVGAVLLPRIR